MSARDTAGFGAGAGAGTSIKDRDFFLADLQSSFSSSAPPAIHTIDHTSHPSIPLHIYIPMGTYFYIQEAASRLYDYLAPQVSAGKIQAALTVKPWPGTEKIADEIIFYTCYFAISA